MNKYELVYIIDSAVEDEARKALIEKFSALVASNGGTVTKVDEWGKRRLAYPINYKTEGYYILVNFEAESQVPAEMERNLKNTESILRYQVVRVYDKRSNVKPRAVRVAPVAPVVEEAPAAEATAPTTDAE